MTTGGVCYKPGRERGAWYELKSLRENIELKESLGRDATFERSLYKSWLKDPEFAKADAENLAAGRYKKL